MKNWFYILLLVIVIFIVSVIPNFPLPFSVPVQASNLFLSVYNRITDFFPFIVLFGIVLSFLLLITLRKYKRLNLKILFICFITVVVCLLSDKFVSPVLRDYSKSKTIIKLQPLIDALENYNNINNAYPESHHLLVPEYIKGIPKSSVLSIRNVEYQKENNNYTLKFHHYYNGWDGDIVIYKSDNDYSFYTEKLKNFSNWRYYYKEY